MGKRLFLTGIAICASIAVCLVAWRYPPGRLRANEARAHMKAGQFTRALGVYRHLRADRPEAADRWLPGFADRLVVEAAGQARQTLPSDGELAALLAALEDHDDTRHLARRMRLRLANAGSAPTSQTLRAATEILRDEGFDLDALWWSARLEYNHSRPLSVPAVIGDYRDELERIAGVIPTATDTASSDRATWLLALETLRERDWARAAALLARYRATGDASASVLVPEAVSLIRSGNPAAAIPLLHAYQGQVQPPEMALPLLAEAYLAAGIVPWGAQTLNRARAANPDSVTGILGQFYPDIAGSPRPIERLAGLIAAGESLAGDNATLDTLDLWLLLDALAQTPEERAAVDKAALLVASSASAASPHAVTALLEYAARQGNNAVARVVIGRIASWGENRAAVYRPAADKLWSDLVDSRVLESAPGFQDLSALLQKAETRRAVLRLPRGATLLVLYAQAYPRGASWPLLHLDLGALGSRTQLVHHADGRPYPLIHALPRPLSDDTIATLSLSLVDASLGGLDDPDLLVAEAVTY